MTGEELEMTKMNGYVEVRTRHVEVEYEVLLSDHRLDHTKILVGGLTIHRCLIETEEDMHDELPVLVRRSVNPSSGEKLFVSGSKVLIRPDVSPLEKILNGKVHILGVDEIRCRWF